jgi:hypothetical protein
MRFGLAGLVNGDGEAERWYGQLPVPSLIGLEATGNSQWFLDLLNQGVIIIHGGNKWLGSTRRIRSEPSLLSNQHIRGFRCG